ncbi:hypothetical protein [Sphingomonas hankookensis]
MLRALEFEDYHDRMERLLRLHYPGGGGSIRHRHPATRCGR